MKSIKRRSFLSLLPNTLVGAALLPLLDPARTALTRSGHGDPAGNSCWLDVCAPFVVDDREAGISCEVVLTSDTFIGNAGYQDGADATEYEVYLYDPQGGAVGADGIARRLTVPAMQTTVLSLRDLLGGSKAFWGGMRIRLRPKGRAPTHASDLFSSAFLRWKTKESFDNVHANPDPLQWQRANPFFYSMPFPPLSEYECLFSLFNPYADPSIGAITLYDELGQKVREARYKLGPHSSLLFDLRRGEFASDVRSAFGVTAGRRHSSPQIQPGSGTIAVTNQPGSVKNFGYLLMNRTNTSQFTVEHPIHQTPSKRSASTPPFDAEGKFKAKNILYTPLLFRAKPLAGLTLDSRFIFSSGDPVEEFLWFKPLITDAQGNVAWQGTSEARFPASISRRQIEREAIKLGGQQNCIFDCSQIALPDKFAGGMSLAVAPNTNHTLMKVEVRVAEWRTRAFTHFRPGLASARSYQKSRERGGLSTDYIVSNARIERAGGKPIRDEVIGVLNIDDKGLAGQPTLQVFSARGLLAEIKLGQVPPFGARHFLLSELLSEKMPPADLSLRLVDDQATLLMSVVHLDYVRRDIALDHGSDRFSTFNDFGCDPNA